jgi:hypothetical protein
LEAIIAGSETIAYVANIEKRLKERKLRYDEER